MNKVREAVYIGSRNFCRQHPDIFVFSEFEPERDQVKLTIEYNGGFAIARELRDTRNPYVFGPRVGRYVDYGMIMKSKTPHIWVNIQLSEMLKEMTDKFDLTFMDLYKERSNSYGK